MKAYPKYKDSGIEWLGEVPEEWNLYKLKYTSDVIMGQSPSSDDYSEDSDMLPFLQGNADFTEKYPTPRVYCDGAKKTITKGSLLISVRAPVGALNEADQEYGIGRGLCAVKPKTSLSKEYIWYMLHVTRLELESLATGSTYDAVSVDEVADMSILIPSKREQQAIASYLDDATSRIDALIEKKEQMIELLKEKRIALITQAVTKGLDPNVPMKDSGIEWLGEVPAHWNVKPLKSLIGFVNGAAFSPSEWSDVGTPIIRIENINGSKNYNYCETDVDKRYHVFKGDLLFGWSGNKGTSFGPHLWDQSGKYYLNQHIFRIETNGIHTNWLFWSLKAVTTYIEEQAHGIIGLVHITKTNIGKIMIPHPENNEIEAIASYLDQETARIDTLIQKQEETITLLREYRSSLIHHAVTGKIDLRGYHAKTQ